jgi:hypothetical protein
LGTPEKELAIMENKSYYGAATLPATPVFPEDKAMFPRHGMATCTSIT